MRVRLYCIAGLYVLEMQSEGVEFHCFRCQMSYFYAEGNKTTFYVAKITRNKNL
jgi:hypothetical protein